MSASAQVRVLVRVVAKLLEEHPDRAVRVRPSEVRARLGIAVEGDEVVLALDDPDG
jgi:hypothetical protein